MAFILVMMAAMKIPLPVTTATSQTVPCVGMEVSVLKLSVFVMVIQPVVQTALMNQIPGRNAHIAQRRATFPAQVFLIFVQSFVIERQLVQISGMNSSLPVIPKM